jgi:hypothetical protein
MIDGLADRCPGTTRSNADEGYIDDVVRTGRAAIDDYDGHVLDEIGYAERH